MSKPKEPTDFLEAKELCLENLQAILLSLSSCIDDGKIDLEDFLSNQLISQIEKMEAITNWDELEEQISEAKILEIDIAAWLSRHGRTSYSLPWPKRPALS